MQANQNKQTVLAFYKQVIAERDESKIPSFISENYIQHSPALKDGRDGLHAAILQLKKMPSAPAAGSPVKAVIASGDLVGMYMIINVHEQTLAVADLFRLQDGLIVEHWDATRQLNAPVDTADLVMSEKKVDDMEPAISRSELIDIFPYKDRVIHRSVIEGNIALVQSSGDRDGALWVYYDFLLLENGKVKKSFCVEQKIPESSANENGMI